MRTNHNEFERETEVATNRDVEENNAAEDEVRSS